ncbi:MAG: chalcone isomerase family protein [Burkholderiaceae bacterium]|nr:chalcone isomerase family protein [Burkholderiaceae bacterium]
MGVLSRLLRSGLRRGQHGRGAVHAAKSIAALLLAGAAVLGAQAEISPATAPLAQLRAAGSSTYTYWGFEVYQASLWVEPGFEPAAFARQRHALELQYLRSFKGRDIAERSIEEMRRIGSFSDAQAKDWLQAMVAAFPDVRAGDRLLGLHLPGRGAQFYYNGRPTSEVRDPEFARLFFGIWLSEQTPAPKLRAALLGQAR